MTATLDLSPTLSMDDYLVRDLLIPKKIWKVVKRLEFVKDVELLLNLPIQTPEGSNYPRIPELYPGEDRYLRLQRKLRSEGKPFDREAIEDAVTRENEWIQFHIDEEKKKKEERDVDQVRMVREEFHDVAEWFLMDATDDDSDWLIVDGQEITESIRAVQVEETVPEEGLELIILDSSSDASVLPSSHPQAARVDTGIL